MKVKEGEDCKMGSLKELRRELTQYKKGLNEKYSVKEISIFGSFVKGQQNKLSDVDILVEFQEVPDLLKFLELERYLEELLGLKVDLVRKSSLRVELKDKILKEAVNI